VSVSTVATLLPEAVLFREEQYFDWRVYSVIALMEAFTGVGLARGHSWSGEFVLGLVIGLVLLMLLIIFLLYMTTEVTPTDVRVWFGWVPTYRRLVPIGTVCRIEVVTYRPIVDFGFWGICSGRDGERALIARGNRGVRLELTDGTKLLIGSQRPEALARALEQALRPGV
jgi:hypothetical protein